MLLFFFTLTNFLINVCFPTLIRHEETGFTHLTPKEKHSALSITGAKKSNIKYLDNCLSPSGLEAPGAKEPCLVNLLKSHVVSGTVLGISNPSPVCSLLNSLLQLI